MFLISAKGKWGTEIRHWSKVMLKSLLVYPWLTDSFAVPLRGNPQLCNCSCSSVPLPVWEETEFRSSRCACRAEVVFPDSWGDAGQGWILGISIALSWACSKAAAFCAAVLLTQPHTQPCGAFSSLMGLVQDTEVYMNKALRPLMSEALRSSLAAVERDISLG